MLERDHELKKNRKYKVVFYENSAMGRMRRGGHLDVALLRHSSEVRGPGSCPRGRGRKRPGTNPSDVNEPPSLLNNGLYYGNYTLGEKE